MRVTCSSGGPGIPPALISLGEGLITVGAQLVELDLSENAFGPDGVRGFEALLKSPACFTLQELKLNNCGMGIGGGKVGGSPGRSLPASTLGCVFWPFRPPLGAGAVVCHFRREKQSPKDSSLQPVRKGVCPEG